MYGYPTRESAAEALKPRRSALSSEANTLTFATTPSSTTMRCSPGRQPATKPFESRPAATDGKGRAHIGGSTQASLSDCTQTICLRYAARFNELVQTTSRSQDAIPASNCSALMCRTRQPHMLAKTEQLRSTCGARSTGRTRRTPTWRSTSAGRWTTTTGWTHRSTRSTCAPAGQQP